MPDTDHSGYEGVNAGRNLLLSALLHALVISAFAGGVFSHTSGKPFITAATVYLYSEPEVQNSMSAPGRKSIGAASLPGALPTETPLSGKNKKKRLPADLQTATSEISSSPAQRPFTEISPGPSSPAAGITAMNSNNNVSVAAYSGPSGHMVKAAAGQGTAYSSQPSEAITRSSLGKEGSNEEIIRKIRDYIARAKYYPAMAKKRGVEGTVMVEFSINPEGKPENLKIIKTSGYEILDAAAMGTVSKAAPLPVHSGRMEVPITFRLNNAE